jgi:hypothetical protein
MDEDSTRQSFAELFSYLEAIEAQSAAVLHFLQEKGIASEEELAPHLERAAKASSVRWTAVRARINRLLEPSAQPADKDVLKESSKNGHKDSETTSADNTKPEKDKDKNEETNKNVAQEDTVNSTASGVPGESVPALPMNDQSEDKKQKNESQPADEAQAS